MIAKFGKASSGDQTDVPRANDGKVHSGIDLTDRIDVHSKLTGHARERRVTRKCRQPAPGAAYASAIKLLLKLLAGTNNDDAAAQVDIVVMRSRDNRGRHGADCRQEQCRER